MRSYVKPLKPVIIKIVIVAVLITFIVWLLLDSRSGERYWTASSRCEVKAAVRVDGGNIDIVDADIKLSPDGKWVLASYHCDSFIRGYDQSLYAYSLDPRNRRWCRVQEYVEPDLWLPVNE